MDRFKTLIIIPAFNEEKTIRKIVEEAIPFGDVLIVNDCSTDSTKNIVSEYDIKILDNHSNQGYTKTLLRGLFYAIDHKYRYAITIDSDGQHDIGILKQIKHLLYSKYKLVLTVRNQQGRWSEYFFSYITSILFGIRDPLSGIKGFNLEKINNPIKYKFPDMYTVDFLLNFLPFNDSVYQLEYIVLDRVKGETSRLGSPIFVNLKIIKAAFNFLKVYLFSFLS